MNILANFRLKTFGFLHSLVATSLLVCASGIASSPVQAGVTGIDQSPLIIQRSLPPNVVLMLDDSGSMDWDYMPDSSYISDWTNEGLRSSSVNGVYYNPDVIYEPPLKADGSSYPDSPALSSAFIDGFRNTNKTDIRNYSDTMYYYVSLSVTQKYKATKSGGSYKCNRGDVGPDSNNDCTTTGQKNYFSYNRGVKGGYTAYYVAEEGDCAIITNASQRSRCDDSAATRQNVANWFSYYRTRMQMAKSGLMNSFFGIDDTFRVGYGSINGNNNNGITSDFTSVGGKKIANVAPFGNDYPQGQKAKFWKWLNDITPNSGTPLRASLDAVGQYYQKSQPWESMESDPDFGTSAGSNELACRQSYTILTSDGFWNGATPSGIGDVDGAEGGEITGENGESYSYQPVLPFSDGSVTVAVDTRDSACSKNYTRYAPDASHAYYYCKRSNGSEQAPSCDKNYALSDDRGSCIRSVTTGTSYGDTLADVAMKYWYQDLRSDTPNEVPTSSEDPAFWQHMATFTLGMGFDPVYEKGGAPIDIDRIFAWANGDSSKAIPNFSWPKPSSDSVTNIADLAHAAVNGRGGFFSAKDPQSFADGIKEALKRAAERVGTGASLAANSTQLQTGTVAYQANYWTAKWKGDMKALSVDSTTGAIATSPTWAAASRLPDADARNIKTYNRNAPAASQYTDFQWNNLSSTQQTSLTAGAQLDTGSFTGAELVAYLRGASVREGAHGGPFRNRDSAVGDIVNSQPVYVGAPNPNQFYTEVFSGVDAYADFASNMNTRDGAIYVASNDGMLHGFNAADGVETFAYVPGAVITSGLGALASPEYGGDVAHAFFNDGELTVADAYFGSPLGWKSVLVGTTGRGVAKAVYAFDVTDPANVKFLWERSAGDGQTNSNYIGQMIGKPVVAQTANGTWSVLIGNGYNSAAGKSALLQFSLDDGTLDVHATTDTTGLAAPAVWMDPSGNGVSTVAWAGDGSGNVWAFPLNDSSATNPTPSSNGTKLFTAKDASGNGQPITGGMLAGKDPATGNTWVFFGTGRYLAASDLSDTSTQSWYGLIVQSATSGLAVTSSSTRDDLAKREITAESNRGRTVTTLEEAQTNDESIAGKSGWYMDLASPTEGSEGERIVTGNQFQGNLLLATTRIPQATDPCNPSGRGWIMALEPFTGTNPSAAFFDLNNDGTVDDNDSINGTPVAGLGFSSLPNNPIFVGSAMLTSFDNGTTSSTQTSGSSGKMQRVSWRELIAH